MVPDVLRQSELLAGASQIFDTGTGAIQSSVGLDASQVLIHLCFVDPDGRQVCGGKCSTAPDVLAQTIRIYVGSAAKAGIETSPLKPWLVHTPRAARSDVVCIEARHAHAAMPAAQVNKNVGRVGNAKNTSFGWSRCLRKGLRLRLVLAIVGEKNVRHARPRWYSWQGYMTGPERSNLASDFRRLRMAAIGRRPA